MDREIYEIREDEEEFGEDDKNNAKKSFSNQTNSPVKSPKKGQKGKIVQSPKNIIRSSVRIGKWRCKINILSLNITMKKLGIK